MQDWLASPNLLLNQRLPSQFVLLSIRSDEPPFPVEDMFVIWLSELPSSTVTPAPELPLAPELEK